MFTFFFPEQSQFTLHTASQQNLINQIFNSPSLINFKAADKETVDIEQQLDNRII